MLAKTKTSRWGFTLVELMVVMAMIALMMGLALPSAYRLFTAGADAQGYNVLAAQCMSARSLAIQNSTYTAVHIQAADNPSLRQRHYTTIMVYDAAAKTFSPATGYPPTAMPGDVKIENMTHQDPSSYDSNNASFITTIVFSPTGSVVRQVAGENVKFVSSDKIFDQAPEDTWTTSELWDFDIANDGANGRPGSTAVRIVQNNVASPVIGINVYTGQLFPRR